MTAYEYRVAWRREKWKPSTDTRFRLFARQRDAQRYEDEVLRGDGRPELSPIVVTHSRRTVGAWCDGWTEDSALPDRQTSQGDLIDD